MITHAASAMVCGLPWRSWKRRKKLVRALGGKLVVANEPHSGRAAYGIAGGAEAGGDGLEPAKAQGRWHDGLGTDGSNKSGRAVTL